METGDVVVTTELLLSIGGLFLQKSMFVGVGHFLGVGYNSSKDAKKERKKFICHEQYQYQTRKHNIKVSS